MTYKPKSIQVNGTQLEYVECGQGEPIVFVHGHMSDYRAWTGLFEHFSKKYRLISYTQRYFEPNLQDADSIQLSVDEHIEDLCQFVKEVEACPAHIVGMSHGANIGIRAAAKSPDLFQTLILYEPGVDDHIAESPGYNAVLTHLRNTFGSAFDESAGELKNGLAIRLLSKVLGLSEAFMLENYPDERIQMFKEHESIVKPFFNMIQSAPLTKERIKKINNPTLLVGGELSLPFYAMGSDAMVNYLPNGYGITMKGVGHGGISLQPAEFVKKAEAFLELTAD